MPIGDLQYCIRIINNYKQELVDSNWYQTFINTLQDYHSSFDEIRCLALGKISDAVNPRFQLALLLLLQEQYHPKRITAWDPVFNDMDRDILSHFNIVVTEETPEQTCKAATLWYIPHGPMSMIESLIPTIQQDLYIGNNLLELDLEKTSPQSLAYSKKARITPINTNKKERWFQAFNSMAIHALSN